MNWLYWIAAAAGAFFLLSGRKPAPVVPETRRPDSYWPDVHEYDEEVASDPELRVPPLPHQMFGSNAFFHEAHRRQTDWSYPLPMDREITPIYEKSVTDQIVRLVGDLMPSGQYYPKGSSHALNLEELDTMWTWR